MKLCSPERRVPDRYEIKINKKKSIKIKVEFTYNYISSVFTTYAVAVILYCIHIYYNIVIIYILFRIRTYTVINNLDFFSGTPRQSFCAAHSIVINIYIRMPFFGFPAGPEQHKRVSIIRDRRHYIYILRYYIE